MSDSVFSRAKWYERDERILAAHHQPALLLDLMESRSVHHHKLLKGTRVFYDDILQGHSRISPEQFLQLIHNSQQLSSDTDISFRWGASLWPGHYGEHSQLLAGSKNLRQALDTLCRYRKQLCPLLIPRITVDQHYCYVQWLDAAGVGAHLPFLVEAYMKGLSSMCKWLSGDELPWQYCFDYDRPDHDAEYEVHLGNKRHFSVGINVMIIEQARLDQPWPSLVSQTALQVLATHCERSQEEPASGFVESVFLYLLDHIREPIGLEQVATAFAMSSATFKRKLKKHHCQFQKLQDKARLHVSLYLLHINGWNNDQVADYLNFNDLTNFRRAFKRWSGLTPRDSRARLSLS